MEKHSYRPIEGWWGKSLIFSMFFEQAIVMCSKPPLITCKDCGAVAYASLRRSPRQVFLITIINSSILFQTRHGISVNWWIMLLRRPPRAWSSRNWQVFTWTKAELGRKAWRCPVWGGPKVNRCHRWAIHSFCNGYSRKPAFFSWTAGYFYSATRWPRQEAWEYAGKSILNPCKGVCSELVREGL